MTTRRIVLGLDGSDGAAAATDWCIEHAPALDAEVVAAHVIDLVPLIGLAAHDEWAGGADLHQKHRVMGEWLEKWVAPLRDAGIPCRTVVVEGNPAGRLDEIATEEGAELIVVGRRGRGGLAEQLLGSVPHVLANHARCPVVVVPVQRPA